LVIQCGSGVVAIFVAVVVWRYTTETQKLREAAVEQVELARRQLALSVKPYLFMKIIDFARGGSELQNTPVAIIDATYRCRVWNPTDRPASNVNILVRNHSTGYFWTAEGADLLTSMDPLEPGVDLIARGPKQMNDGLHLVREEYGADAEPYLDRLRHHNGRDYSAVFFRDANGQLYAAVRTADLQTEAPFLQEKNQIWDSPSPA